MSKEMGDRWWSRALPVNAPAVKMAVTVAVATLTAGLIYLYVGPLMRACFWDVGHHSTAAYQGLNVRVPWMWRQEDTPAGQQQLRLVRARLGEPTEFESIVISEAKSSSAGVQTATERLRALADKLGYGDFQGTAMSLDPRFSCVAPHFTQLQTWQISCLSMDNRWSANLYGPFSDKGALELVLQSMTWR
jgi:hypothetical protein